MALFVANAIELKIGQKILLENVSFEIPVNKIIAIVGQNGSGKSSFLKILAGLLDIDGGKTQITKGVQIGYLAQDFELDEHLTSKEILQKYAQNDLKFDFNYEPGYGEKYSGRERESQNLAFNFNSKKTSQNEQELENWEKPKNLIFETEKKTTKTFKNLGSQKKDLDSDLIIKIAEIQEKIEKILTQFQIPNKPIKELSGGQQRKLAIAKSLFLEPQILILDEPTNHLDIESVEVVENILKNFAKNGKTVILVSHDRYFLDNLTSEFWEINNAKIYQHQGKWANYLQNKEIRVEIMSQTEDKKQAFLKREIQWVRAGVKARSTKDKGRLERFYDLESEKNFENEKSVSFLLPPILPLGNKILELEGVCIELKTSEMGKNFEQSEDRESEFQTVENSTNNSLNNSQIGNKNAENYQSFIPNALQNPIQNSTENIQKIIQNFDFTFHPKTVLGIIGPNGSGKTTLIRVILGEFPFVGKITIGQNTVFNYQDQNKLELNQENSIFEELCQSSETIKWGQNTISSRKYLKNLLFENEQILTKIKNLSGGQKARILLAKILKSDGNCLILDEPTNDLDIETIGLLEKSIQEFQGICIVISHDRYFLNQVCTDILALTGRGKFVLSTGNYDEYLGKIQPKSDKQNNFQSFQTTKNQNQANSQISPQPQLKIGQNFNNEKNNDKYSWQENRNNKKNLQKIEKLIESLETEIKNLEIEFENVNLYAENPDKYSQKAKKLESLKLELNEKLIEWEKLEE